VRASAPDGLPLVGRAGAGGPILAVGARRNGWLLAPLVAELVLKAAAGEDGGAVGERLSPDRFAV
jgi:glycine oxidase